MNSVGAMSSPKRPREESFREGSSLVDVDDDCLGNELLAGDSVIVSLVLDLGTVDFRGFGVGFALGLGVRLGSGGTVVEPGSDASKRACAAGEISAGPSSAPVAVSGRRGPSSAIRSRASEAGTSVPATDLVVVFLFFAGLVSAAGSSSGVEEIAASGFGVGVVGLVGFVGNGSTLLGGSIWLRLNGAMEERSQYGSGALLVGRISLP